VVLNTNKGAGLMSASSLKGKNTMKILILSNTVVNNEKVKSGDVVDVETSEARALIGYGKAEEYKGKPKKESNRSVGLEKSETKVKKRSK
jgi:hypothetical protein